MPGRAGKRPLAKKRYRSIIIIVTLAALLMPALLYAQNGGAADPAPDDDAPPPVSEQVDVQPEAEDTAIEQRLESILNSTGWFTDSEVEVQDGVVFLRGMAGTDEQKRWAGELAGKTQDVVAVVNQIDVRDPDIWNYDPAVSGLQDLWRSVMRSVPFWVFGLLVLIIFFGIAVVAAKITRAYLKRRQMNTLLQNIMSKAVAVVVFFTGIYIVFHVANLTQVALTVLGGTGLLGIVLGIAFRDITENFLASIFLSFQNPFQTGDFVEIQGQTGIIQALTIRATLLMSLEGNQIQIPNATVYKNSILNYSSNPHQRLTFVIGISHRENIVSAQKVAISVLENHPAILKEPEPWVLVDRLAAPTIDLKLYFWVDTEKHNSLKVSSSVLRLIKTAFDNDGIEMPDEKRERIFPDNISVQLKDGVSQERQQESRQQQEPYQMGLYGSEERKVPRKARIATEAEGGLRRNEEAIRKQARQARAPEESEDLLSGNGHSKRGD